MLAFLLFACGSSAETTHPPSSPATPPGAEAAAAPTNEQWLAAGACKDDGAIAGVRTVNVGGKTVYELNCAMFAYQGTYEYWWSTQKPALQADGKARTITGLPELTDAGRLTWLDKARGPGDCGEYYVYELSGDAFAEKEHRSRACTDDGSEPPPPESWPIAAACESGDEVLLTCTTDKGKVLAVCGSTGRLQYRFGPPGAPELVFPANADPKQFKVEDRTTVQSMRTELTFANDGYSYVVTSAIGGGAMDGEWNNLQGVTIEKDGKLVATVDCAGELTGDWDKVRAIAAN